MEKLSRPQSLQWLGEEGEMKVNHQEMVPITFGRYQDAVVCDVLPIKTSHILLGQPWHYGKKAIHDGFNHHSFFHRDRKITMEHMSPQEVHNDQVQLKQRRKEAKVKEKLADEKKRKQNHIIDITVTLKDLCTYNNICFFFL